MIGIYSFRLFIEDKEEKHRLKPFTGGPESDFQLCAMRMMAHLEGRDLEDIVRGDLQVDPPIGDAAPLKACRKIVLDSKKALSTIFDGLGDRPLRAIHAASEPADVWEKVLRRCAIKTISNKTCLLTSFISKKYQI